MSFFSVITTIQPPTKAARHLARVVSRSGGKLLVLGDRKGPADYPVKSTELLSLERQSQMPLRLAPLLPVNHYTRKNLGYLVAISRGATCIYETDDDNKPGPDWRMRSDQVAARMVVQPGWCNVFARFTDSLIWPRGYPLDGIRHSRPTPGRRGRLQQVYSPIQQGLVDRHPDVDAIWRLVLDRDFTFNRGDSVALGTGVWCPFNSQSTWWWPAAYALMYLPSFCTFRMTDIWRSFVAQRCLWEMDATLVFHQAEAVQDRNVHNLLRDFRDEVPGYLGNGRIVDALGETRLVRGPQAVGENLLRCYERLVEESIFPRKELRLVRAWLWDLGRIQRQVPAGVSC